MSLYRPKSKPRKRKSTAAEIANRNEAIKARKHAASNRLSMQMVEAYWRKVEDPNYYSGVRIRACLRSALGDLNR